MRTLGIDFGERRIGLAISDRDGRIAVPLETIERIDDRRAIRVIQAIVRREKVGRLVIGDPRLADGTRGDACARIDRFANRLRSATGLSVDRVDESLTSVEAHERLRETGADQRAATGRVDAVAAQILLQESLDSRRDST